MARSTRYSAPVLPRSGPPDDDLCSDPSSRALSVAAFENDFVEGVYNKIAAIDSWLFGPTLQTGRLEAMKRLPMGHGDTVLEVGVGTGINAALYPSHLSVTGIDFVEGMLHKAERRLAARNVRNVRLLQMDAAHLEFPDDSFDLVYAPYVISVVPDPVAVAKEMRRVCRPGGHFAFLNHFLSENPVLARAERWISPLTIHAGFRSDLDLPAFLAQADLTPLSIEKVNIPRIWSLVTCTKD